MDSYSPDELAALLKYQAYASRFKDFPPNFIPPGLFNKNYVPPDRGGEYIAWLSATLAIACVIVPLRLALRAFNKGSRRWGWDDTLITLGFLSFVAYAAVCIASVPHGCFGKHVYDCHLPQLVVAQRLVFVSGELYVVAVLFLNLSICFVVKRLHDGSSKFMGWLIWGTTTFFAVTGVLSFFLLLFASRPIAASWDLELRLNSPPQPIDGAWILVSVGIIYALSDLWMLVLPALVIWRLRISITSRIGPGLGPRIGLVAVFVIGSFALAAAIVRIFYINGAFRSWDPTYKGVTALTWNQIELFSGLVAVCLPGFSILFPSVREAQAKLVPTPLSTPSYDEKSKPQTEVHKYERYD